MNRKSIGEIVNKLLLFQEENYGDFTQKKMQLFERVLQELKDSKQESKYECICSTLETTFDNKGFFIEFMKDGKLIEILYTILEESKDQPKKLICIMKLLIKINENALKFVDSRVTTPLSQENPLDFINMFTNNYQLDNEVKDPNADTDKLVKKFFANTFSALEKSKFNFLDGLDDYSSSENNEFKCTYLIYIIKKRKMGMKKLSQIELFRTILDILVNVNSFNNNENQIKKMVEYMNEKKLFWKMHKLFFDFPFSNIYQILYNQIMDIILNKSSPDNLIDFALIKKGEKEEKNLVQKLIDEVLNNMKFTFKNHGTLSFHPNFPFEVSILNKIFTSENKHLRDLIKDNKNLEVFNTTIGDEVNKIFKQKFLLPIKDIQINSHDNDKDNLEEEPISYFCEKNFMQVMDEDLDIYKIYLKGGDFNKILEEKREKERIERINKKKMEEDEYISQEEELEEEELEEEELKEEEKKEKPKKEEKPKIEEKLKKEIKGKNLDIHSPNIGLSSNVNIDTNEGLESNGPKIDLPNVKSPQIIQINENNSDNISYNCTECSSLIEIISLLQDNTFIKFKCINKDNSHEQSLSIKDYLIKMKNHHNKQLNDDKCKVHTNNNEKYICYCFKCKNHLCRECLKSRTHLIHNKSNIIEIQPIQEELNIMKEIINVYKNKVEKLEMKKMIFNQNLEKSLNDKKFQLKKKFEEKTQINNNNRTRDLKLNNEKFMLEIEIIKRKYEEEIRIKKNEYEKYNTKINNKYKEMNQKNKIILNSKIKELHQKYDEQIERLAYDKKIEILNSFVKFNEIVYNTYISYNHNYYNCINLNNLLINYYNNENIKNNVIKRILKDDYDKVTKLILERKNEIEYDYENEKEVQKGEENDKIRILEMEITKLKEQMAKEKEIVQKTDQNIINKKEETNLDQTDFLKK